MQEIYNRLGICDKTLDVDPIICTLATSYRFSQSYVPRKCSEHHGQSCEQESSLGLDEVHIHLAQIVSKDSLKPTLLICFMYTEILSFLFFFYLLVHLPLSVLL